jgi:transposase
VPRRLIQTWIQNEQIFSLLDGPDEVTSSALKLIKRQMYGKAGFALLRQRVLHAL